MKPLFPLRAAFCAILLPLLFGVGAQAQPGSGVGGGRFSEQQLNDFFGEVKIFFDSPEALELYPEIEDYNRLHPKESFQELIQPIRFKVVHKKVFFRGEERDCVPMVSGKDRWVECNAEYVPENTLDNQPTLYAFLTHESFVFAGIEPPCNQYVPSTYEKSGRLALHRNLSLVSYRKWVPGKGARVSNPGIHCEIALDSRFLGKRRSLILQADAQGSRLLIGEFEGAPGKAWDGFKDQFRREGRSRLGSPSYAHRKDLQLEVPLRATGNLNRVLFDDETGARTGNFVFVTPEGDSLELEAQLSPNIARANLEVELKRDGKILVGFIGRGKCAMANFSGSHFQLGPIVYRTTEMSEETKSRLLRQTLQRLHRLQ